MSTILLSGLYIYPIKSLGGISLTAANLEKRGLQYDRRWMLIDEDGLFITQRKYHDLALLQVNIADGQLIISHKNDPAKTISFTIGERHGEKIEVTVWDDQCAGIEVSPLLSAWFTDFLEMKVRLVEMPEEEERKVDPRYAIDEEIVSFADGYPCLLIGQSSLDGLNEKLDQKIAMDRFRPNLVFTGGDAHHEDSIATFEISGIHFTAVKPCARCVLITVDQQTGKKSAEPLKTLAGYRTRNKKIMFGQNLIHSGSGTIHIGDELIVTSSKPII